MRTEDSQKIEVPHSTIGYFAPLKALANVLNIGLGANARPFHAVLATEKTPVPVERGKPATGGAADMPSTAATAELFKHLLILAGKPVSEWRKVPDLTINVEGVLAQLSKAHRDWMLYLMGRPTLHMNMGKTLFDVAAAASSGMITSKFVVTPTTGYPREVVFFTNGVAQANVDPTKVDASTPRPAKLDTEQGLFAVSPGSPFARDLAGLLMGLDIARFGYHMVPSLANLGGDRAKERPIGANLTIGRLANQLMGIPQLYLIQATVWFARMFGPFNRWRAELAMARDERSRVAIEARLRNEEFVMGLPLHPLLTYVTNGFKPTTSESMLGDGPHYWVPSARPFGGLDSYGKADRAQGWSECIDEVFLRQSILEHTTSVNNVDWGTGSDDLMVEGYANVVRRIRGLNDIEKKATDLWSELTSQLGWSELPCDPPRPHQLSAYWMLTNGVAFTDDPSHAALGIRPCLALSNAKYTGTRVRSDDDFNTKIEASGYTRFVYSVLPVKGYQDPTDGTAAYIRVFAPLGMNMGEPSYEVREPNISRANPIFSAAIKRYKALNPQYVKVFYRTPGAFNREEDVPVGFRTTDWDGYAEGETPERCIAALTAGYAGQTEAAEETPYMFSNELRHRIIVQNTFLELDEGLIPERITIEPEGNGPPILEVVDSDGRVWKALRQDGAVSYAGDNELTNSSDSIERIVESFPIGPFSREAEKIGNQVIVADPTEGK